MTAEHPGLLHPLLRVPVPWVFVGAYLLGALAERLLPSPVDLSWRWLPLVGALVFTLGAIVSVWGLLLFRRARTTTVPGEVSNRLVTRGPYRFTRNPMYVGLTLAYLGEAGILQHFWPIVLLPLVLYYVNGTVIPVEEARLQEHFPEEYDAYRARVRRWL